MASDGHTGHWPNAEVEKAARELAKRGSAGSAQWNEYAARAVLEASGAVPGWELEKAADAWKTSEARVRSLEATAGDVAKALRELSTDGMTSGMWRRFQALADQLVGGEPAKEPTDTAILKCCGGVLGHTRSCRSVRQLLRRAPVGEAHRVRKRGHECWDCGHDQADHSSEYPMGHLRGVPEAERPPKKKDEGCLIANCDCRRWFEGLDGSPCLIG